MDPITDGSAIFRDLALEFGSVPLTRHDDVQRFFERLLELTKGVVIVDFLDSDNWDYIEGFELDRATGWLTVIRRDYRKRNENPDYAAMRRMMFPAELYTMILQVQSIVPVVGENFAIFLMNGRAVHPRKIRDAMRKGADEFELMDNSFFEKHIFRRVGTEWQVTDFHNTPIFTTAFIPKNLPLSSTDSKNILYRYNMEEAFRRIDGVLAALETIDPNDEDAICEKAGTARRILESVLKLELCYRRIAPKKDYANLLLGDLAKLVNGAREDDVSSILDTAARYLNELAHDSGQPVTQEKGKLAALLVLAYARVFEAELPAFRA